MQPPVPNFNPRPPRGGRRQTASLLDRGFLFQSTPSARRATAHLDPVCIAGAYFNPRPPRGGRQPPFSKYSHGPIISIHALREEGDASSSLDIFLSSLFQSTPSARRATRTRPRNFRFPAISIHALREESDSTHRTASYGSTDFNPRPPRGERLVVFVDVRRPSYFNPRPPRGERQQLQSYARTAKLFQSTPSARRATAVLIVYICVFVDFNPRPPRGGRPGRQNHTTRKDDISIHALRGESDRTSPRPRHPPSNFNPQSPHGRRLPTS